MVSIETQIRDPSALAAACRRLGLEEPVQGTVELFTASATGLIMKLFSADRTEQDQTVVRIAHEALLRNWPRAVNALSRTRNC